MKGAGTASSPAALLLSRQITGDEAVPAPASALHELALQPPPSRATLGLQWCILIEQVLAGTFDVRKAAEAYKPQQRD